MSSLSITLIDVAHGDSILVESVDDNGARTYGLIDSNDTSNLRASFIFLKRHLEKRQVQLPDAKPVFQFVLLSHSHADHGQGLKSIMREFGTERFWYPKSLSWGSMASLIRYANRSSNVEFHQSVDSTKILNNLGDTEMSVLWPPSGEDRLDASNENNNSVVLVLALGDVSFVLTGDAEEKVWKEIRGQIPPNTKVFKVPHHGSVNGSFDSVRDPVWLNECPQDAFLPISVHIVPHDLPDTDVIDLFNDNNRVFYRTDQHYHLTFQTDGANVNVTYSHEE